MSASAESRMAVSGLARKFWTITSWRCPNSLASPASASRLSARSVLFSPIPTRIPEVNGTARRPASVRVRSRTAGSLSGLPW